MITNFKIFESSGRYFWYIPYSDKEKVLFTIDKYISDKIKEKAFNSVGFMEALDRGFIGVYFGIVHSNFVFGVCKDKIDRIYAYKNYEKDNFEYRGQLKVEEYEVDAKKYNL